MNKEGLTIIETLIGITFLALIVCTTLGLFIVAQIYFHDGIAMAKSQATARIVIEKMVRPDVREGSSFSITDGGDTLNLIKYDGTQVTFRYLDNSIRKNDSIIGSNIVKIPGTDVFQEIVDNELLRINFGVKNKGISGHYKEVHISTDIKLRN